MQYINVREPWEIHDTIRISNSLFGAEANSGFYTTFNAFGAQQQHLFFKRRSEGNVHRAYCNQLSEDRTDFVFRAFSVGLLFLGPPTPLDIRLVTPPADAQEIMPVWWTTDFPRHVSASLQIGQNTNLVLNGMMMSPGYGPKTAGVSYGVDDTAVGTNYPEMVYTAVQGEPVPSSRQWIAGGTWHMPEPIGVPKGELLELRMNISEYARIFLQTVVGPSYYHIGGTGESDAVDIDTSYAIQASVWGYREVQQRGELHK